MPVFGRWNDMLLTRSLFGLGSFVEETPANRSSVGRKRSPQTLVQGLEGIMVVPVPGSGRVRWESLSWST